MGNIKKILLAVFSLAMLGGYLVCLMAGVTGNIQWLQMYSTVPRYVGYQWVIFGSLFYFCQIASLFFLNSKVFRKLYKHKIADIVFFMPVVLLFLISFLRNYRILQ